MEDLREMIALDRDRERAVAQLQRVVGLVADITLNDDTTVAALLIGVSSSALILESWDAVRHSPSGDPFVLQIEEVRSLVVP